MEPADVDAHAAAEAIVGRAQRQRDLVRRGYDAISLAYRSDDGEPAPTSAEQPSRYAGWIAELAALLPAAAQVVDLGCGAGIPATRELAARNYQVLGVDFSAVQLIHVPLADQRPLFPRIRSWLRPGGYLLAIVGATRWTGTAGYLGADMFWDHADTATYLRWLRKARLTPLWNRYIPEGNTGHTLTLAQAR